MNRHSIPLLFSLALLGLHSCEKKQERPESRAETRKAQAPITIPVWPNSIPDSGLIKGTETYHDGMVRNVSTPTMTIYSPTGKNTGAAVIVFPGGGYTKLAIDLEGNEICKWLASIGITGILLKYRVPGSGPHYDEKCDCEKDPVKPLALQDAQRTLGVIRARAKEWNIDPEKIGVMGFSAGGHLVADLSTHYRKRAYAATDDLDNISCKPNFGIVFYPGHMTFHTTKPYELNTDLPVDRETPPTFILQAGNDPIDPIENSLVYYMALQKAGVPAEYHVYAEGGHAFGLNESAMKVKDWQKLPIAGWENLVERWLKTIKMTSQ
ncbi:alpha/beta hydrolase [Chryseobacterium sp.]|uniref:alpha/beta hydrolase n=1 Tax=Chryseobacterium sp. TaxID=1871047 RepID=UPI0011C9C7D1|nr:alpha/beta hydrolase [Chryseobacterium sp.]TXF79460.1 alpha/beta hydrolase [Chryseobacterium sp.]